MTRQGCGRVAIMQATDGLPNCYTLECNFASGRRINHLSQKVVVATGHLEPESAITDCQSKFYTEGRPKHSSPAYTVEVFHDVGRAFMIGLLDFYECNPVSRIPTCTFKTLENIKTYLIQKNNICIPWRKKPDDVKTLAKPYLKGSQPRSSQPVSQKQT
jgi:hypothetical protein